MRYRAIAAKGGWPSIPRQHAAQAGTAISGGAGAATAAGDRRRSRSVARKGSESGLRRDRRRCGEAVRRAASHQARRRIVDAETVSALNVPVEQRIRTIELNLERWRWLPDADAGALLYRERPRLPPRSDRKRQGGHGHARRRRRARQQDADLCRRDDACRLQPVLERAAGHRGGRNHSAGGERPRLSRAQQHGGRRSVRRSRRSVLGRLVERERACASGSGRAAAMRSAA